MDMNIMKGFLTLFLLSVTIITVLFPVAIFVHEGSHYMMYSFEGIKVTSIHVLDHDSLERGLFGYITTLKESRFGFLVQEAIAYFISFVFLALILLFFLIKPLKLFVVQQLELMGIRRNPHYFS